MTISNSLLLGLDKRILSHMNTKNCSDSKHCIDISSFTLILRSTDVIDVTDVRVHARCIKMHPVIERIFFFSLVDVHLKNNRSKTRAELLAVIVF